MIKAVIFDIDGVLIDSCEANYVFFRDLMNKFSYDFMTRAEYTLVFHAPMKDIVRFTAKSAGEEEIEKIWKAGKDRVVRYPDELVKIPEKLEEVLKSLSSKYTLGIVTGRVRSSIYAIPQLKALSGYFKTDVSYEDTEKHKPDPEPLLLVAQKLGILPKDCVYVGDAENDMLAARAAGMRSIIYHTENLVDADANFSFFKDLPEIIKSI